ncbi:MAG: hydrogen peroxide-inducible genes activator [Kofleriaceae bacterium]|jgi:LysR family hydrogen peroxide-inducible transcriptional activator|nr:hydrogen peroxide-inducible genes activator [Kofleriaceae bacterium]MBP9169213.1 hydrogen peroxide-inducible genes activator [Kofleriaceae bacterium]MBP9859118.1 hydrogen peroxide-inducible genes activator [Kofleriaceae bacterium]
MAARRPRPRLRPPTPAPTAAKPVAPSSALSLRQLEYAVAVADERSFRRAAAACAVTQPGLSAQIAALEHALGVQLFERDRRRVLVTAAGAEVVARARIAIAAASAVLDGARASAEPLTSRLRLGVIPTIAPYLLPSVLPAVRARYPRLQLILREERTATVLALLDDGRLDAGILALPVPGDLAAVHLYREDFLLAAPRDHALAAKPDLREADLDGETVLLLEDGHCLRDQALAVCSAAGAHESAELRATSLPTLTQMVAGGLGVTLLPERSAPSLAGRGSGVSLARFARHPPGRDVGLVWRMSSARGRELGLLAEVLAGKPR